MKTRKLLILLQVAVATILFSCKKSEKPQTAPTVITNVPTNITTNSASASGKITDNGNSEITEAGFVYSNVVAQPTTADNKILVSDIGAFTAELKGLSSGKTYRIRAFAINSKGTGYGELRTFETGNQAPIALNVQINGELSVGKTLTATYTYSDDENDAEAGTTFQWYTATSADGVGETAIAASTSKTLEIQDTQVGKFIRVSVIPKAATGTSMGIEAKSAYTTSIGAETVTFIYNGAQVTYGTIASSKTGKKWLDRNLGATRVAQSVEDYLAYGDLFQWGRLADGHQLVTRTGNNVADATFVNGTTSTSAPYQTSSTDVPSHNKFIVVKSGDNYDWRLPQNNNLWQGVNGKNNPCPAGWRIPTQAEWVAEGITNGNDAFSKLKLSLTGRRDVLTGNMAVVGQGVYWSSTSVEDPGYGFYTRPISFTPTTIGSFVGLTDRGNGLACRCIKD